MRTKLFFSSEAKSTGVLRDFCATNNWILTDKSLIRFEKIPFETPNNYDVIFFSSPRCVNYFISENEINSSIEIACVGQGTASILSVNNLAPKFIGENSGIPEEVAKQFVDWLGERVVLFPLPLNSKETICKHVSNNQKRIVRCYETVQTNAVISDHDVYVFTSPSNVNSFITNNSVETIVNVIAWGRTTAQQLIDCGITPIAVLDESSEDALVKILNELKK